MSKDISYGWAGEIARINVGTGRVSKISTEPYKKFIGGMGIANKIMYDEVPAGTHPYDEASKVIIAVGPLTASGVPLGGRTTASFLSTFSKDHLVVDAHMGGMLGARLKFSGHDAIIIEGKSDTPVYIYIENEKVQILDASDLWGMGTREVNEVITRRHGNDTVCAAIGKAGENLLPYAVLINSRCHSGGAGIGSVLGSKKVKCIAIKGNRSVKVADPKRVAELSDLMLSEIIGSNNNHVVPSTQQSWAEFWNKNSRWTAREGLAWEAAEGGPVYTGEPKPYEINTVGMRCMKSVMDLGPEAAKYTVKMDGCFSCPIHCFSDLKVKGLKETSGYETGGNTCAAQAPVTWYMDPILNIGFKDRPDLGILWNLTTNNTMDRLGIWCNYAQLYRDLAWCIHTGIFKRVLPTEEYAAFDWNKFSPEVADPSIMVELLEHIARNDNEMSYIAHGPLVWCERWNEPTWFDNHASHLISHRGWPVHHANENCAQVGTVCNVMFNRDDMIHSSVNFQGCGLPDDLKKQIAKEVWGSEDAYDPPKNYTPMNKYKAEFIWWSIVTNVLHDSLTLCNWVWPMTMSPTKERNYRGDLDLEAKFYTAVTGEEITTEELYKRAAAVMTLQRANTIRGMKSTNLRYEHDQITEWVYDKDPELAPFTPGTDKMERADYQLALSMTYKRFNWDEKTGALTREGLAYYGLEDIADDLGSQGLLV